MSILRNIKSAWGALWGADSEGFVSAGSGVAAGLMSSAGDERWLGISAYFACIRNISEDIGKLPLITYKRLSRGKERATDHKYYALLRKQPHPAIGAMSFRETIMRFALGWGNGYARILRLGNGDAFALEPVHPSYVASKPGSDGAVNYSVKIPGQDEKIIPAADMLHIHGLSSDGVNGLSVAAYAAETLSFSGSAQSYGNNLFSRGARPGGILRHPGKLAPDAKENLAKGWEAAYGGKNSGKTAVLDHGIEYQTICINPVDAQYLETRQFTVEEVARWFRMPLHKIQYLVRAQGWSTLDAMNTDYLTDTLMPWLVRWEEELLRKLFTGADAEYFAEHLVAGLLRGDQNARSTFYRNQFSIGALSINEIRESENMNPIEGEGGDKHFVPLNMTPAEFANSISGGQPAEKTGGNNA